MQDLVSQGKLHFEPLSRWIAEALPGLFRYRSCDAVEKIPVVKLPVRQRHHMDACTFKLDSPHRVARDVGMRRMMGAAFVFQREFACLPKEIWPPGFPKRDFQ